LAGAFVVVVIIIDMLLQLHSRFPFFPPALVWLLSFNLVVSVEIVHFENASITITIVVKLHRILATVCVSV